MNYTFANNQLWIDYVLGSSDDYVTGLRFDWEGRCDWAILHFIVQALSVIIIKLAAPLIHPIY